MWKSGKVGFIERWVTIFVFSDQRTPKERGDNGIGG
jgi:hypothetical protein